MVSPFERCSIVGTSLCLAYPILALLFVSLTSKVFDMLVCDSM